MDMAWQGPTPVVDNWQPHQVDFGPGRVADDAGGMIPPNMNIASHASLMMRPEPTTYTNIDNIQNGTFETVFSGGRSNGLPNPPLQSSVSGPMGSGPHPHPSFPVNIRTLALNAYEAEYYGNLYRAAMQSDGLVSGASGAAFLMSSGLEPSTLHEIWRLADENNNGHLTCEEFFIACRLTAHCQNGQSPNEALINIEPSALPHFQSFPSTTAEAFPAFGGHTEPQPNNNNLFTDPAPNSVPVMEPVSAGRSLFVPLEFGGTQIGSELPSPLFRSTSPSDAASWTETLGMPNMPPTPGRSLSVISVTEQQQYVTVFRNRSKDGFVEGADAVTLMQKSNLSDMELYHIWSLADQDMDGRLNIGEFVLVMHLITKRKKGYGLPRTLTPELEHIIHSVNEDKLNGRLQPSLTTSESLPAFPSPVAHFNTASDSHTTTHKEPPLIDNFTDEAFGQLLSQDEETKTSAAVAPAIQPPDSAVSNSRRGRGRKRKTESSADEGTFSDKVRDASREREQQADDKWLPDRRRLSRKNPKAFAATATASTGGEDRGFTVVPISSKYEEEEEQISIGGNDRTTLVESAIESNKVLRKRVQRKVDHAADQSSHLESNLMLLKEELKRETEELSRQLNRKTEFEEQIRVLRRQFDNVKEERRKVELERVSAARDLGHYQDEIAFLRLQIADVKSDIEVLCGTNAALNEATKSCDSQIANMYASRKDVLEQIKEEREAVQDATREISELRTTLQRMQRQKEEQKSDLALKQETFRQAQQDRCRLFRSLDQDRNTLASLKTERLSKVKEKFPLVQDMNSTAQEAWLNHISGQVTSNHDVRSSPATAEQKGRWASAFPAQSTHQHPMRDAKGVPATAPTIQSINSSACSTGMAGLNMYSPTSSPERPPLSSWTSFGTSNAKRKMHIGTEDLKQGSSPIECLSDFGGLTTDEVTGRDSGISSSTLWREPGSDSRIPSFGDFEGGRGAELENVETTMCKGGIKDSRSLGKSSKSKKRTAKEDRVVNGAQTPSFGDL